MIIKAIETEWFQDYKVPSMFIAFPKCSFKCERECGVCCCQNSTLTKRDDIHITLDEIVRQYKRNPITKAIICGGLDPMDSFDDLHDLVRCVRIEHNIDDDIVIYTGYTRDEVEERVKILKEYKNIVVKFGRFIPNGTKRYDDVLGVRLASDNQYAERIS